MENKIKRLNEIYKDEIKDIVGKVSSSRNHDENKSVNFGNFLNDSFGITELNEYNDYVGMMNQVEKYNPKLASSIEKYLTKEINLMALLALHVSVSTKGEKSTSLEEISKTLG